MILTDSEILDAIRGDSIRITDFDKSRLGSNSYDLTLSKHLLTYKGPVLNCKKQNPFERMIIPRSGLLLFPDELYLGATNEVTTSPYHAPFIEGKSSIGRLGISVHITVGVGDIGFSGSWTLEITVVKPIVVYANMPIAQIMFMVPSGPVSTKYGKKKDAKYLNQEAGMPMPSMMWKNFPEYESPSHDSNYGAYAQEQTTKEEEG